MKETTTSLIQPPDGYGEWLADPKQQAVAQLPWGHNLVLLTKLKQENEGPPFITVSPRP